MRISDWSSDVCSSDLFIPQQLAGAEGQHAAGLDRHLYARLRIPADAAPLVPQDKGPEARNLHIFAASHRIAHQVQNPLHHCGGFRSEEHTSELQSLMRISYAVFCLKKKNTKLLN